MLSLSSEEQQGEQGSQMEQSHCDTETGAGTLLSLDLALIGKTEIQKYSLFCNFVDEL